ncbi:polysaccharide biosynthesis C-terminal domain-containing protein [Bacillus thuringiensis]|uniref:MATE family efflux transporter n=1 Tax=Bacillus thuringiensis TaxID=1428 RepID=UPI003D089C47
MKKILAFTIPTWSAMVVNSLIGITDFWFLSQISKNYMSIVGIAYIPFSIISSLIVGIGIEANRTKAKGNPINFWSILVFVLILSSSLSILAQGFSHYLLFFTWDNPMYNEIKTYFSIICYAIIPTSILYVCTGILRGKGLPKKTLIFSFLAVILNFSLDFLFIKINLLGNPLAGCAIATVIADSLVAAIYILYFVKKRFVDTGKMDIRRFMTNALINSTEKLFSVSTLQVISNLFIAKISVMQASVYFGLDRFFSPLLLFSYSFFEWVVYSKSKGIKTSNSIYLIYFVLLVVYNSIVIQFMNLDRIGFIYSCIYVVYLFIFFIERTIVANFFAEEQGKIVNYVILSKNILFLITLFIVSNLDKLSLLSFGVVNLLFIFGEAICLMVILQKQNKYLKMAG